MFLCRCYVFWTAVDENRAGGAYERYLGQFGMNLLPSSLCNVICVGLDVPGTGRASSSMEWVGAMPEFVRNSFEFVHNSKIRFLGMVSSSKNDQS